VFPAANNMIEKIVVWLGFLLSFSVLFFDGYSVDVIVCAERNNLQIRRNVMHHASANSVHVKVVAVHESHAAEQEDFSADFA
jgi:hypothetical protein